MMFCRIFCLWMLAAPTTAPATGPAGALTLHMSPAVVDRVMFNRDHPPADTPTLKPGEAALTRSEYECSVGVSYEMIRRQRVGDHWHAVVRIRRVDLSLKLTDTIFLPMAAPVLLRAHEEGHREMNERIYREGEAVARSAAAEVMSKEWGADGPNADSAGNAASDAAVHQFCTVYLDATSGRASRLGDIYDRFTSHGRNQVYVANAIRLSFLEEQKLPTTRPSELLHATTEAGK
jgi:hypothetical protein